MTEHGKCQSKQYVLHLISISIVLVSIGCKSTTKNLVAHDSQLDRLVRDGHDSFNKGRLDEAEKSYRKALVRAWSTDDPYESGTAAYNLAACLVSKSNLSEASDWLTDARVELCRAGASTGNAWLLSSEIALAECRLEDAERFVGYAAQTCPPCETVDTCCLCGPSSECCSDSNRECCAVPIPCIAKKAAEKQQTEECKQGYQARIELARARIAIQQFDVQSAQYHLGRACQLTAESCDFSLLADRHDVAALIHDVKGEYLQAGSHRDREAQLLRCIGIYRAIPGVLEDAAESYCSAGRPDLAIDRMMRSARIWFARGNNERAWQQIELASGYSLTSDCDAVEIRLALTAKAIRDVLRSEGASTIDPVLPHGADPTIQELNPPIGAVLEPAINGAFSELLETSPESPNW